MKPTIVRKIKRADADSIRTLGELGVATVHEAQGRSGLMRPYMRPIYVAAKTSGSAITISSQPGDNLMIHAALELCQPGDLLVVTPTAWSSCRGPRPPTSRGWDVSGWPRNRRRASGCGRANSD